MPGLMQRGAVLTASRVSNFAILMLSPLLLVRILDVDDYGRYQEFMIYATLFITICSFGIDASLTYFLPRHPGREREFVSQNSAIILVVSSVVLVALFLGRGLFLEIASYDFTLPLAAYVFFFVNLNWLEYYWIVKRRTDLVLYYSVVRLTVRVIVLLSVAYLAREVEPILWSLVAVEAARFALVAAYLLSRGLLTFAFDAARAKEQLRFAGPLGVATLMQQGSMHVGKLFIGGVLGPTVLAYYAIAAYLLPIVRVMRGAIADVIFPELVRARDDLQSAVRLWQRSNIAFCVILFPPFVLLTWHAELFVTTLFTEEYRPAVPVFQIYALWLLRRCFTMDVLLRSRGKTGFMLTGTVLSVLVNLTLMVSLYYWLGLVGPAIAYIAAEFLLEAYYALLVRRELGLKIADFIDWRRVGAVAVGCLAGIPLLIGADFVAGPELVRAAAASCGFIVVSWAVAYALGVSEVGRLVGFALHSARKIVSVR